MEGMHRPWCQDKVIERLSPVSYKVQVNGMVWKRNVDQLKEIFISQTQKEAAQDLTRGIYPTL